jgi:hypothetical protein
MQAPVSEQEELEMLREKVDVLEEELSINKARLESSNFQSSNFKASKPGQKADHAYAHHQCRVHAYITSTFIDISM